MENKYLNLVKEHISNKIGHEKDEITSGSYFQDDLNIGEIELMEIIQDIEEELDIDLTEESGEIETVAELVHLVEEKVE